MQDIVLDQKSKRDSLIQKKFILFLLITFAIIVLVPIIWVFVASLKQNKEFYGNPWTLPEKLYFQNFSDAWNKARMGEYMLTSVSVTFMAIIILLFTAIPASYTLSRFSFKFRKLINTVFMGGLFINVNYIVVPIFLMLVSGDKIIRSLFGTSLLLNNPFILAVVYAATALPFTIYLLSGYFVTLPRAYEESAYMDGAGYWRTMISVIIPMATPSIITVVLFNFLSFWNEYIISLTLLSDPRGVKTLPVGLMNLMKAQNAAAQYGQMYAGLVLAMLPTLILFLIVQKKLTQGMTLGGLKG
mgnify:CR=1 FL=1|jgi:N-acetylglucosamine transport system permease protein